MESDTVIVVTFVPNGEIIQLVQLRSARYTWMDVDERGGGSGSSDPSFSVYFCSTPLR